MHMQYCAYIQSIHYAAALIIHFQNSHIATQLLAQELNILFCLGEPSDDPEKTISHTVEFQTNTYYVTFILLLPTGTLHSVVYFTCHTRFLMKSHGQLYYVI